MAFVFGAKRPQYPILAYVNDEPISTEIFNRVCADSSQVIIVCDQHHSGNAMCMYDGYSVQHYGLSTMFDALPSLGECQSIWKTQINALTLDIVKHNNVLIFEANPVQRTHAADSGVKHCLGRLLPVEYRQGLQHALDALEAAIAAYAAYKNEPQQPPQQQPPIELDSPHDEDVQSESVSSPSASSNAGANDDDEEEDDDMAIENGGDCEHTIDGDGQQQQQQAAAEEKDEEEKEEEQPIETRYSVLIVTGFDAKAISTLRQFVQIAQYIETQCLYFVATKQTLISERDKALLLVFESHGDALSMRQHLQDKHFDDITGDDGLQIQFASHAMNERLKSVFDKVDVEKTKFCHEMQLKRALGLQQAQNEGTGNREEVEEKQQETKQEQQQQDQNHASPSITKVTEPNPKQAPSLVTKPSPLEIMQVLSKSQLEIMQVLKKLQELKMQNVDQQRQQRVSTPPKTVATKSQKTPQTPPKSLKTKTPQTPPKMPSKNHKKTSSKTSHKSKVKVVTETRKDSVAKPASSSAEMAVTPQAKKPSPQQPHSQSQSQKKPDSSAKANYRMEKHKHSLMDVLLDRSYSIDDGSEFVFDVDADKVSKTSIAKYLKQAMDDGTIFVWQTKNADTSQWLDMCMSLSLTLNILPINDEVSVRSNRCDVQFTVLRTSESNATLTCNSTVYKLNRIGKSMQNGVYIPRLWERELLNRTVSDTYLYTIDMEVFSAFDDQKYAAWAFFVMGILQQNKQIQSLCMIENWRNYHAFHMYSAWKCAAKKGEQIRRVWYMENSNKMVLKKGFYRNKTDTEFKGWTFYADHYQTLNTIHDRLQVQGDQTHSNMLLLCQVCVSTHYQRLLDTNGFCTINETMCGLPELCIRL